ncbi:hypothetical protein ON010_g6046 [Phytophthora cinnamomi]|nr:hypothetical protein ON010_g6046 [Phytophthora cinnamomi]
MQDPDADLPKEAHRCNAHMEATVSAVCSEQNRGVADLHWLSIFVRAAAACIRGNGYTETHGTPGRGSEAGIRSINMKACKFQSQGLIVLVCLINMLNYLDRGIIPGAPQSFRHFITSSLGVAVTDQSVYFGLLSSAFIIGHSVLSIVFGYFALSHRPFRIIALGTSIWIVAIVICAISEHVNSYALLIVGRVLSGAGEASFQCVAPPFIDRHAPPERASLYVGIYLASVFVGEAIGFVYGSAFADSSLTWAGGYYLEAVLMVFLVCCCLFCVPDELNVVPPQDDVALRKSLVSTQGLPSEMRSMNASGVEQFMMSPASHRSTPELAVRKESFFRAWWDVLSNTPFLLFVLGNGAYTFTLGVFNTYGPDLFVGLGLFGDETSASLVFGIIVAVGGLLGTPLGGYLIDRQTKDTNVAGKRCFVAMVSSFVGLPGVLHRRTLLHVRALGAANGGHPRAVPGVAPLDGHLGQRRDHPRLRRRPGATVMGVVWDAWAPNCGAVAGSEGDADLNPLCSEDQGGLKNFMLLSTLWMLWAVLLWALAAVAIKRRQQHGGFELTTPADHPTAVLTLTAPPPATAGSDARRGQRTSPQLTSLFDRRAGCHVIASQHHAGLQDPVAGAHRAAVSREPAQLHRPGHHPRSAPKLPALHHLVAGRGRHGPVRVLRAAIVGLHHRPFGAVHRLRVLRAQPSTIPHHCAGDEYLDRGHRDLRHLGARQQLRAVDRRSSGERRRGGLVPMRGTAVHRSPRSTDASVVLRGDLPGLGHPQRRAADRRRRRAEEAARVHERVRQRGVVAVPGVSRHRREEWGGPVTRRAGRETRRRDAVARGVQRRRVLFADVVGDPLERPLPAGGAGPWSVHVHARSIQCVRTGRVYRAGALLRRDFGVADLRGHCGCHQSHWHPARRLRARPIHEAHDCAREEVLRGRLVALLLRDHRRDGGCARAVPVFAAIDGHLGQRSDHSRLWRRASADCHGHRERQMGPELRHRGGQRRRSAQPAVQRGPERTEKLHAAVGAVDGLGGDSLGNGHGGSQKTAKEGRGTLCFAHIQHALSINLLLDLVGPADINGPIHVGGHRSAADDEANAAEHVIRNGRIHVVRAFIDSVDEVGHVVPAADDEAQRTDERPERRQRPPAEHVPASEAGVARVFVGHADKEDVCNGGNAEEDTSDDECPTPEFRRLRVPGREERGERAQHLAQQGAVVVPDSLDEVEVGADPEEHAADHEVPATEEPALAVPRDRVLGEEVDGAQQEEQRAHEIGQHARHLEPLFPCFELVVLRKQHLRRRQSRGYLQRVIRIPRGDSWHVGCGRWEHDTREDQTGLLEGDLGDKAVFALQSSADTRGQPKHAGTQSADQATRPAC